jgi:hypothetical protein
MTAVRMSVARSESTPAKPILAKIAVSAANTAENSAQVNQFDAMAMLGFLNVISTAQPIWCARQGFACCPT